MQLNNNKETLYIVSVYQDNGADSAFSNPENHAAERKNMILNHIDFIECLGRYNGQRERSFIVKDETVAILLATKYKQSCYMELIPDRDGYYQAYFAYTNGYRTPAGVFGSCAPVETSEDCTYIPSTDTWFKVYPTLERAYHG